MIRRGGTFPAGANLLLVAREMCAGSARRFAMIRKLTLAVAALGMIAGLSACNTVRGAGDDLNSAADAVDKEI
jgi:entericidin B